MTATRRIALAVAGVAAALLVADLVLWLRVDHHDIGRSDFTATYVGATLLRQGHGSQIYDESLEAPLHATLIAPDSEGNLPFVNPPAAAVLTEPLTLLNLTDAYRLWSLLQLGLLALAVVVATRAAPWPPGTSLGPRIVTSLVALASLGTLNLLLLGQWDGLPALGLALAYASWRGGHQARGGFCLALTAAVAKPHLALGLAAFMLGRRNRRTLAGGAAGLLTVVTVSLVAVGPAGVGGFVHAAVDSTSRWPLRQMLGFTGLTGSWLGDTAAAHAIAAAGTLVAVAACGLLGDRWRRHPQSLEPALAAATALSLLAAPHLLGHDLTLVAPALVWSMAAATARDPARKSWPGKYSSRVLGLCLLFNLAALLDLGNDRPAPPGRIVPWTLLAGAAAGWAGAATMRKRRSAGAAATLPAA